MFLLSHLYHSHQFWIPWPFLPRPPLKMKIHCGCFQWSTKHASRKGSTMALLITVRGLLDLHQQRRNFSPSQKIPQIETVKGKASTWLRIHHLVNAYSWRSSSRLSYQDRTYLWMLPRVCRWYRDLSTSNPSALFRPGLASAACSPECLDTRVWSKGTSPTALCRAAGRNRLWTPPASAAARLSSLCPSWPEKDQDQYERVRPVEQWYKMVRGSKFSKRAVDGGLFRHRNNATTTDRSKKTVQ